MEQILRSLASSVGRILRMLGYGWIAFMVFVEAAFLIGCIYHESVSKTWEMFISWLVKTGPYVTIGMAAVWLGGLIVKWSKNGPLSDVKGASTGISSMAGKTLSAVGQSVLGLVLLFSLGLGWLFVSSAIRNRGYAADLAFIRVGVDADTALMHLGHADRVSVDWMIDAGTAPPETSFKRPRNGIQRPLDSAGKPVGVRELRAEYRIFAFMRKFLTVSFDEKNTVSGVKRHLLD